jgi:succinate dehydrogenase/fumarate reductase flavoprotein subunit
MKKDLGRRDFLKLGAIGAAGVAVGLASKAQAEPIAVNPKKMKWDEAADVVVIGTGLSGLVAAIEAHDAGAKALIIDKAPKEFEGGNSRISGNLWLCNNDLEKSFAYYKAMDQGHTSDEVIRFVAAETMKTNEYLKKFGVKPLKFTARAFAPEHPTLPGADSIEMFADNGTIGKGIMWGKVRKAVDDRKIKVIYETPAHELIQSPSREVIGVMASRNGKRINIKAAKAVIVACGGFEFNEEMNKQMIPGKQLYKGSVYNTGDGVRMTQYAGCQMWHNHVFLGQYDTIECKGMKYPAILRPKGDNYVWLNRKGERFMDEKRPARHGFGHREYAIWFDGLTGEFTNLPCYAIYGAESGNKKMTYDGPVHAWGHYANYKWSDDNSAEVAKGWLYRDNTIEGLAKQLGLDPAKVKASVDEYNKMCASGKDTAFGRPAKNLKPVTTAPFTAAVLWPGSYNTFGGPKKNTNAQALDAFDKPIPRLYVVGELGSYYGFMYNGGGNLTECLFGGWTAGPHAAKLKKWG